MRSERVKPCLQRPTCTTINLAFFISLPIAVLLVYDIAIMRGYLERELAVRNFFSNPYLNNTDDPAVVNLSHHTSSLPRLVDQPNYVVVKEKDHQSNSVFNQPNFLTVRHQTPVSVPNDMPSAVGDDKRTTILFPNPDETSHPPRATVQLANIQSVPPTTESQNNIVETRGRDGDQTTSESLLGERSTSKVMQTGSEYKTETERRDTVVEQRMQHSGSEGKTGTEGHGVGAENSIAETVAVSGNGQRGATPGSNAKHGDERSGGKDMKSGGTEGGAAGERGDGITGAISKEENTGVDIEKTESTPILLMVVLAIPDGYPNRAAIAERSHRAYAKRHGYRLVVQREYLGNSRYGHNSRAVSLQKLLVCQLLRGEQYVLIVDYDVVIAPWSPPIHLAGKQLNGKVGIVDESQPSAEMVTAVLHYRTGRIRVPREYYRSMGFKVEPKNGLLNTGVLLFQPQHQIWLEQTYYEHVKRVSELDSHVSFHYEQALIGAELMQRNMVGLLSHAWNRNWMWYNWTHLVGGEKYYLGNVFRKSYFLHFLWAKTDMPRLHHWMLDNNITFEPNAYTYDVLP